jgi:hypothetical protein
MPVLSYRNRRSLTVVLVFIGDIRTAVGLSAREVSGASGVTGTKRAWGERVLGDGEQKDAADHHDEDENDDHELAVTR